MNIRVPRTWFNGLVDDNGTGNGTLWNRAAIGGGIDATDQAFALLDGVGKWLGYSPLTNSPGGSKTAAYTFTGQANVGTLMFYGGLTGGNIGTDGYLQWSIPTAFMLPFARDTYIGPAAASWTVSGGGTTYETLSCFVNALNSQGIYFSRAGYAGIPAHTALTLSFSSLAVHVQPASLGEERQSPEREVSE
jgi:hypothetical protein